MMRLSLVLKSGLLIAALAGCSGSPVSPFEPLPMVWEPAPRPRPALPPGPSTGPWQRIGTTVRGRAIEAAQFGDGGGGGGEGGGGAVRIYIIGSLRGDEPEASRAALELGQMLWRDSAIGHNALIRIVRDVNPDGTARGERTNTRGVDLVRNWPSTCYPQDEARQALEPGAAARLGRGPASEIEVAAVHRDLVAFKPDLVVVLRSSVRGPRLFGIDILPERTAPGATGGGATQSLSPLPSPAPPPAPPVTVTPPVTRQPVGQRLTIEFASAARSIDPRFRGSVPTDPVLLSGSIEALVARDMQKPVLQIELQRGQSAVQGARALREGLEAIVNPGSPVGEWWKLPAAPSPASRISTPVRPASR